MKKNKIEKIKMAHESNFNKLARFLKLQNYKWVHEIVEKMKDEEKENERKKEKIEELEGRIRYISGRLQENLIRRNEELMNRQTQYEEEEEDDDDDEDYEDNEDDDN